jgi:small subunit ribosomal protein S1
MMRSAAEPHQKLAHDDLLAIATMDPAEIAKLLDVSAAKSRVSVGMRVTAKITRIGQHNVFVDVGAKSEAMLPREDLPEAKVGDEITAYVIGSDESGIHLSQKLSGATAAAFVEEARHAGVPVEGRVASRNAGGYEIRIGSVRAFCPTSQIDRFVAADPDSYLNQTFEFKVVEAGDNVIVSRRAMIEADLEVRRARFWADVSVGQQYDGVVSSVQPFGLFVDLNGVDGLVPKREVSWEEGDDALASFKRGQALRVRVIDVDFEARKLTLSARDPAASPWTRVGADFVEGGTYGGTVVRVAPFGAFIELGGGLQGLMHATRAGRSGLPREGAKITVKVTGIDRERQRLELTAADYVDAANVAPETPGALVKAVIRSVKGNGLEVEVEDGSTGWIDAREIDLPSNTVLAQRFRAGRDVQARVVQFDVSRRHYKLSLRLETPESGNWKQTAPSAERGTGLGTFADLFAGFKPKR